MQSGRAGGGSGAGSSGQVEGSPGKQAELPAWADLRGDAAKRDGSRIRSLQPPLPAYPGRVSVVKAAQKPAATVQK